MKIKIILILLFLLVFNFNLTAQISVSKNTRGSLDKFKPEVFKAFKETTTIFVLSNIYSKAEYENLLNSYWTVTPFKVVLANDFDYHDYLTKQYSFAHIISSSYFIERSLLAPTNFLFYMLDTEKIANKIDKTKDNIEKFNDLIENNIIEISNVNLFINADLISFIHDNFKSDLSRISTKNYYIYSSKKGTSEISDTKNRIMEKVYNEPTYYNFTLGMFKNYIQKINELLNKEEFYWVYENEYLTEVQKLKNAILYIPEHNKIKFLPSKYDDKEKTQEELIELFEDYPYKYEFIKNIELDNKILKNEEIYYLRYVKVNNRKFFNIVNGKTGQEVYRDHKYGINTFNIDSKDFKNLVKAIEN